MPKIRCSECGDYVDRSEALRGGVQSFCSDECRKAKSQMYGRSTGPLKRSPMKRRPAKNPMPAGLRDEVIAADGKKCRMCRSRQDLHVHHVLYRSQGGEHIRENLLTLCMSCHDIVHSNKRLYQPACLALLFRRETTGDKVSLVRDFVEKGVE